VLELGLIFCAMAGLYLVLSAMEGIYIAAAWLLRTLLRR